MKPQSRFSILTDISDFMKKTVFVVCAFLSIIFIQSCDTAQPEAEKAVEAILADPSDSLFVIKEGGYDFAFFLPKDLMIENDADIEFNGATGDLNVRIGENFWIVASLEGKTLAGMKEEISNDMLFDNRIIEETENSVLYQRMLPDGKTYDYNFRSFAEVGGKAYFFRTSEAGEYSIESVDLMKSAIESVRPGI